MSPLSSNDIQQTQTYYYSLDSDHIVHESEDESMASEENEVLVHDDEIQQTRPVVAKKPRLLCLDILRGATVMLMVLVNNQPGEKIWWPFDHMEWSGRPTPTDLIFPTFLLCMGFAMGIVFRNVWGEWSVFGKVEHGFKNLNQQSEPEKIRKFFWLVNMKQRHYERIHRWLKIFKRTILLFLIGLVGNIIVKKFNFTQLRVMGVMQRISLVYFINALILNVIPWLWLQIITVLFLQALYFGFMMFFYVPKCGRGVITEECSAESFFDTNILGSRHIYRHAPYDPEGLLSTLSAVGSCYVGVLMYKLSQLAQKNGNGKKESDSQKIFYKTVTLWFVFGAILVLCGETVHALIFEYNKKIWSTSYVLFCGGIGSILLGLIGFVVDILGFKRGWTLPFLSLGSNPLLLYVLPTYVVIFMYIIPIGKLNLMQWIFKTIFASWIHPMELANVIYAIVYESIWMPLAILLHWKKIYIKL